MEKIESAQKLAKDILEGKQILGSPEESGDGLPTGDQEDGDTSDNIYCLGTGRDDSDIFKGGRITSENLSDGCTRPESFMDNEDDFSGSVMNDEDVPDVPKMRKL